MILLDTHTWLWWVQEPNRLSSLALDIITTEEQQNGLLISAISVWEIAVKVSLGKLRLPLPLGQWYEQARQYPGVVIEPLDPLDAIASTELPGEFHKDPADRILVAIARRRGLSILSRDEKIIAYPHVESTW
ncbi:MAG: type II toxin-antitoxin system VapC family toxin [Cyanobacteria bacterium CAN_BIN43]|nr:type II toxin-antitoxin system VapC family toxin [Cyanobacteria bacterium CAN_BIN43]